MSPEEIGRELTAYALSLPEAWEDHPWGDSVVKVRKKIFLFIAADGHGDKPRFSVKLPESADHALSLEHGSPTAYGLGRHGWVTVELLPQAGLPPVDVLVDWVEESYRAVAPKTLVKQLDQLPPR